MRPLHFCSFSTLHKIYYHGFVVESESGKDAPCSRPSSPLSACRETPRAPAAYAPLHAGGTAYERRGRQGRMRLARGSGRNHRPQLRKQAQRAVVSTILLKIGCISAKHFQASLNVLRSICTIFAPVLHLYYIYRNMFNYLYESCKLFKCSDGDGRPTV